MTAPPGPVMLPKAVTSPQKKGDKMFGLTNGQIAKCKDIYKVEDDTGYEIEFIYDIFVEAIEDEIEDNQDIDAAGKILI